MGNPVNGRGKSVIFDGVKWAKTRLLSFAVSFFFEWRRGASWKKYKRIMIGNRGIALLYTLSKERCAPKKGAEEDESMEDLCCKLRVNTERATKSYHIPYAGRDPNSGSCFAGKLETGTWKPFFSKGGRQGTGGGGLWGLGSRPGAN